MRTQNRKLDEILGRDGLLAKVVGGYDWRPQQLEMGRATLDALTHDRIVLIEAPTGVGKTMAYLVPAALHARAQHEPVVISSYTKALQDQIIRHEAPRLRRLVHPDLQVFALKGRNNYLCRRRWDLFVAEEGSGPDGHWVVERLQEWVFSTASGDFADAPDLGSRAGWVRARIGGDPRFCRHRMCRGENGCFHKKARRVARESDIVVVNHSLLLADALGAGILPDHRALIVDEAHLLPDAALDPLTIEVSENGLLHQIRSIGGAGEPGASDRMRRLVRSIPGKIAARGMNPRLRALEQRTQATAATARRFYDELHARPLFPPAGTRRRCRASDLDELLPSETDQLLAQVSALQKDALQLADEISAQLSDAKLSDELAGAEQTVRGQIEELGESLTALSSLLGEQPRDRVPVIMHSTQRGAVLASLPLDPGPEIRAHILDRHSTVVLTSATLAAGDDLAFYARQIGLAPNEALALQLPNPFPLAEQLRVIVPVYSSDPRAPEYARSLAETIALLGAAVPRKMLVLFTAHETLEQVHALVENDPRLAGHTLVAQLRGASKEQLANRFREAANAILLGTASFWYGVDFPGDELELLIIARLPFPVPSDPRVEALQERLEEEGRSHFNEYALPEAVLRFRQGLGRLIRRAGDRGVCVVCDPRLLRARYGRMFQAVLPEKPLVVESPAELVARTSEWFRGAPRV